MALRYLYIFITLLFINNSIHAQNNVVGSPIFKIDSLLTVLELSSQDTSRVNILVKLSDELSQTEPVKGRVYGNQALELSQKIHFKKGLADAYYSLGYYDLDDNKLEAATQKFNLSLSTYLELIDTKNVIYTYLGIGVVLEELNQYDSAIKIYQKAFLLSRSIKEEKLIAHTNYYLGSLHQTIGNNELALKYILKSHNYYKSRHLLEDEWYTLNILGIVHDEMGMYAEALDYYLEALDVSQTLEDKQWEIIVTNNIAVLYNQMQNNEKAINYYESAYESSKIIGDKDMESTLLDNIARLKAENGDTITAILYTRMAMKIQLENGFTCSLPYSYEGMGDIYIGKNMLDSAIYYLKKAEEVASKCNDLPSETSINRNLGIAYKKQKKYSLSEEYLKKSLKIAHKHMFRSEEKDAALELYNFYKEMNNTEKALAYHEMFQNINDSIFNLENSEKVNRLTAEFEFRKEKKLIELENEKNLLKGEAQIKSETQIRNGVLVILFMAIIFFVILYQSYVYIKLQNIKLKKLNDEKNTMMGVVAHDLRNPLNNIKTIIPMLKGDSPEMLKSRDEFVDLIEETTDRMYGMIDRILDVNAIEEMKVKLKLEKYDMGKTVISICKNFQMPAQQKSIILDCDIEENRHFAKVDEGYFTQIIENLVSNALKFSSQNTMVFLEVTSRPGYVDIAVRDQGPGISKDEQGKLFKKYEKISNAPTAGESTTGLGLSIVKKYVEVMKGEIKCESTLGKGATFTVSFKA